MRFAAIALSFAFLMIASNASAQTPRGSYLQTCTNIQFDGYMLEATCLNAYGQYRRTQIEAEMCERIQNQNGQLVCERRGPPRGYRGGMQPGYDQPYGGRAMPLPPGSWRATCRNAQLRGTVLIAMCASVRGQLVQTSADVRSCRSFGNNNGHLSCE